MATNRQRLSRAIGLLDEILQKEERRIKYGSQGSSRELLSGLYRLRKLLAHELQESNPDWMGVVVPLLREAAQWLGEIINNYRYIFRRFLKWKRHVGIDREARLGNQVLPVTGWG